MFSLKALLPIARCNAFRAAHFGRDEVRHMLAFVVRGICWVKELVLRCFEIEGDKSHTRFAAWFQGTDETAPFWIVKVIAPAAVSLAKCVAAAALVVFYVVNFPTAVALL